MEDLPIKSKSFIHLAQASLQPTGLRRRRPVIQKPSRDPEGALNDLLDVLIANKVGEGEGGLQMCTETLANFLNDNSFSVVKVRRKKCGYAVARCLY